MSWINLCNAGRDLNGLVADGDVDLDLRIPEVHLVAAVIPLTTRHYPMLRRNLLYTGVTRPLLPRIIAKLTGTPP
jgi:hypothetical protein